MPFYGLVSSQGAKEGSFFLYLKTKGEAEAGVIEQKIQHTTIFRPGLITERDNDFRFGECVASVIPFIKKIAANNLAKAIVEHSLKSNHPDDFVILEHNDILKIIQ